MKQKKPIGGARKFTSAESKNTIESLSRHWMISNPYLDHSWHLWLLSNNYTSEREEFQKLQTPPTPSVPQHNKHWTFKGGRYPDAFQCYWCKETTWEVFMWKRVASWSGIFFLQRNNWASCCSAAAGDVLSLQQPFLMSITLLSQPACSPDLNLINMYWCISRKLYKNGHLSALHKLFMKTLSPFYSFLTLCVLNRGLLTFHQLINLKFQIVFNKVPAQIVSVALNTFYIEALFKPFLGP